MNDDDHRYGALRESYAFEYAVLEQADKYKNTNFAFETYDGFSWYLALGPLSNINDRYLHGSIPYWNDVVAHPDYDAFWKKEAWISQLHASNGPEPERRRLLGSGRSVGAVADLSSRRRARPRPLELHGRGPVVSRSVAGTKADSIGLIALGGHETAREFRETIEAPFFRFYLHGRGEKPSWRATTFQSGANRWRTYAAWPPGEAKPTNLYLHVDGTLSFDVPKSEPACPRTANMSRTRRTRSRTGGVLSRPLIPRVTGGPGRSKISGSSISGPTSSPS